MVSPLAQRLDGGPHVGLQAARVRLDEGVPEGADHEDPQRRQRLPLPDARLVRPAVELNVLLADGLEHALALLAAGHGQAGQGEGLRQGGTGRGLAVEVEDHVAPGPLVGEVPAVGHERAHPEIVRELQ